MIESKNKAWGFYGTIESNLTEEAAEQAWPLAFAAVQKETKQSAENVRSFLDSRHGRHFADTVLDNVSAKPDMADAVQAALQEWKRWKVDARLAKDSGLPKGAPYLQAFVSVGGNVR